MVIYLQSHRRRPIRLNPLLPYEYAQGMVPFGWCSRCGGEVYQQNADLCVQCRKEKQHAIVY